MVTKSMQAILTINSGSSTIKFAVFTINDHTLINTYSGLFDRIPTDSPHLNIKDSSKKTVYENSFETADQINKLDKYEFAICKILEYLQGVGVEIIAAGHRVVHGSSKYCEPIVLDEDSTKFLKKIECLAPLHQPYNLIGIEILRKKFPKLPQVACFDTAFHATCNNLTKTFAIPKKFTQDGIIRYGFHGLSYEYITSQFDNYLPKDKVCGKIIILHLGQGASMCGVVNKKSFATSLSFSALDGLPMGTRCGSIDPGVLLYLMSHYNMDYTKLENLLYKESGLLGVSGISSDMRVLLDSKDPDAGLAVDLFVYRTCGWIGMIVAEMQGLDALIFTAGIGENSILIREKICERLSWLGAKIDQEKNNQNTPSIHYADSKLGIYVIPTNEELMIANHAFKFLNT